MMIIVGVMSMLGLRKFHMVKDWLVLQVANAYETQEMERMAIGGFAGFSSIQTGLFDCNR